MRRYILILTTWILGLAGVQAQEFFNLTAEEVRIDSLLPVFGHSFPLGANYADSTYTVSIDYPEFIDMSATDIERYKAITTDPLPAMPEVQSFVGVSRREGVLYVSFVPLVQRDGKYQKLVSFTISLVSSAHCPLNTWQDRLSWGLHRYGTRRNHRSDEATSSYPSHHQTYPST